MVSTKSHQKTQKAPDPLVKTTTTTCNIVYERKMIASSQKLSELDMRKESESLIHDQEFLSFFVSFFFFFLFVSDSLR